jgi:hypothetical protein
MRTASLLFLALLLAGCGGPSSSTGLKPMVASKGAKLRVLNLSGSAVEASLKGATFGRALETETASAFKLCPGKGAMGVTIGADELTVDVEKGKAYTVVYYGAGKSSVIVGEPTEVASEKAMVYFHSLDAGETGKATFTSGVVTNVSLGSTESKEVAVGSYVASVKLSNGKEAKVTFDLAGGNAKSVYLVGGASGKFLVLENTSQMIIVGPGGASPVG